MRDASATYALKEEVGNLKVQLQKTKKKKKKKRTKTTCRTTERSGWATNRGRVPASSSAEAAAS
jgi:hypothetical protein